MTRWPKKAKNALALKKLRKAALLPKQKKKVKPANAAKTQKIANVINKRFYNRKAAVNLITAAFVLQNLSYLQDLHKLPHLQPPPETNVQALPL